MPTKPLTRKTGDTADGDVRKGGGDGDLVVWAPRAALEAPAETPKRPSVVHAPPRTPPSAAPESEGGAGLEGPVGGRLCRSSSPALGRRPSHMARSARRLGSPSPCDEQAQSPSVHDSVQDSHPWMRPRPRDETTPAARPGSEQSRLRISAQSGTTPGTPGSRPRRKDDRIQDLEVLLPEQHDVRTPAARRLRERLVQPTATPGATAPPSVGGARPQVEATAAPAASSPPPVPPPPPLPAPPEGGDLAPPGARLRPDPANFSFALAPVGAAPPPPKAAPSVERFSPPSAAHVAAAPVTTPLPSALVASGKAAHAAGHRASPHAKATTPGTHATPTRSTTSWSKPSEETIL